ncbi:GNAT family N-acetyltransferase [Halorussus gelatinilyticus]|uniref:tRNA(Met) cytidine acetyltransferase TmcA n=1 Tax=Halorussus gelatinilyticus TaxID=2937524 RepID=A0A8U0IG63_9EURY|nr:GNAT family N-acetyltransferase [Halorussus gelatinilyticus]UPW00077.1 GNAT family N-acetyltransferase [Halorussus gelatinilyticus]
MTLESVAAALREEARATDERRLLVLTGDRDACYAAADAALDAAGIDREATTLVGTGSLGCERVGPERADRLLGTTRDCVVFDAHADFRPNALGRVVGAVDGGGLLVLLAPSLDSWPDQRTDFDRTLAVPPDEVADVTGNFRRRFAETLRDHPGIAVVEVTDHGTGVDAELGVRVERDGLTHPAPRLATADDGRGDPPADRDFPDAAYDACLTGDQMNVVRELEALRDGGAGGDPGDQRADPEQTAVVVEADRGRGKSSAAGIAAGSLAAEGADVLVTAPEYRSCREVFVRAAALLETLGVEIETDRDPPREVRVVGESGEREDADRPSGGRVRFAPPTEAANSLAGDSGTPESPTTPDASRSPDAVFVDEAAALSVRLLERFLAASKVAFTTTIHGYEGAGRGFSVRFRDRLAESDHEVVEASLADPIRYAAGDPVEVWAFRALLLDARPPVDAAVADADPESVAYRTLSAEDLLADETLLREVFGLLVLAHYRTEPDDLARLLDAPNLTVRALVREGGATGRTDEETGQTCEGTGHTDDETGRNHVVAVALLAREGGLPADVREHMYEGGRVRGNMLPDVLTSQLRDEAAGIPVGRRVMRIATHHAVRSRGLGSRLLGEIRREFEGELDWLGVGYGATPDLLRFWRANGYRTVQLSTTRNDTSGEYSALMLDPLSEDGADLHDRHAAWFASRVASMLADPLRDADPDVVRELLRSVDARVELDLSAWDWRAVAASAYGPGLYDAAPRPFRRVALRYFVDAGDDADSLSAREERLLVRKVLQGHPWPRVADELGFHSAGQCMRALGDAYEPLVDRYGDDAAMEEKRRYAERE